MQNERPDTSIPVWLEQLRQREVRDRVDNDPRTQGGRPLGVDKDNIWDVCGGGQAEFDEPWNRLSPDDRALLYAYSFQRGHLQELLAAFRMLFRDAVPETSVVIDLGCGPFTGGLALAEAMGASCRFDYIGVDRSASMRRLGERLADAVRGSRPASAINHRWVADATEVEWELPPSWRPVLVVVSYLLASPSLDVEQLLTGLDQLVEQLGRGTATIFFTNSAKPGPNERYTEFRDAVRSRGFTIQSEGESSLEASRESGYPYERRLRYALFHRPPRDVLHLD